LLRRTTRAKMYTLLEEQSTLGGQIIKHITNIKGFCKKTQIYLEKNRQEVLELYAQYQANDVEIVKNENLEKDLPYFEERNQNQRACETILADLKQRQEVTATPTHNPGTAREEEQSMAHITTESSKAVDDNSVPKTTKTMRPIKTIPRVLNNSSETE